MNIQNNIIFSILATFFWLLFIIWNRFIRTRLPKNITEINVYNIQVFIIICLFVFSLILFLYFLLKKLTIIPRPNSIFGKLKNEIISYFEQKSTIKKAASFIKEHIIDGPKNVYTNIIYRRVPMKRFFYFIGEKLIDNFEKRPIIPYIFGFVVPKIIPWALLFFELSFTHSINFFYKSLFLLLIPLILNILLYMLKHHSQNTIDWYKPYFEFDYIDEQVHVYFKKLENPSKENLETQERLALQAPDIWIFNQFLYSVSYKIEKKKEDHIMILRIVIYGLMSIDFLI